MQKSFHYHVLCVSSYDNDVGAAQRSINTNLLLVMLDASICTSCQSIAGVLGLAVDVTIVDCNDAL